MARIQYGAIVTDISGKLGGHSFSRSGYGGTISTKNNTNARKKLWGYLKRTSGPGIQITSQMWRTLSDSQRAAWDAAAALQTKTDPFGNKHVLSGYAFFMRCNNKLHIIGQPYISDPVAFGTVTRLTLFTLTVSVGSGITVAFDNSLARNEFVVIGASQTGSTGADVSNPRIRVIQTFDNAASPPYDITTNYVDKYGEPIQYGKVGVSWYVINGLSGQYSVHTKAETIVTA